MFEYEQLFCKKLHEMLKEKINGSIYVAIDNWDCLYVKINCIGNLTYHYNLKNASDMIKVGLDTKTICCAVIDDFKKFILSKYLY